VSAGPSKNTLKSLTVNLFIFQPIPDPVTETHLANSLPTKDNFILYQTALLDHLSNNSTGPSLATVLRTLAVTNAYEFGQCQQRALLKRKPTLLWEFFGRFSTTFSRTDSYQMQCLSSMALFLQSLLAENVATKVNRQYSFLEKNKEITYLVSKFLQG